MSGRLAWNSFCQIVAQQEKQNRDDYQVDELKLGFLLASVICVHPRGLWLILLGSGALVSYFAYYFLNLTLQICDTCLFLLYLFLQSLKSSVYWVFLGLRLGYGWLLNAFDSSVTFRNQLLCHRSSLIWLSNHRSRWWNWSRLNCLPTLLALCLRHIDSRLEDIWLDGFWGSRLPLDWLLLLQAGCLQSNFKLEWVDVILGQEGELVRYFVTLFWL